MRALGAISGTSVDAIDIAVIETDGQASVRPVSGASLPWPETARAAVLAFLADDPSRAGTEPLDALETLVTDAFAGAIAAFMAGRGIAARDIDVIGLHGQTVWHRPAARVTRQLGRGSALARRLGVAVVDGFRLADVVAGGQGAPLAPLYHAARAASLERPLAVLNLGGVGNVTWLGEAGDILAFDTGPGSALMDDVARARLGLDFDRDGAIAARGTVRTPALAAAMTSPYLSKMPPKSLDRNEFHGALEGLEDAAPADAMATLAALTVGTVAAARVHFPALPRRWLVCGGGRRNTWLMAQMRSALGVPVEPVEAVGWDGDLLEAECFAYLAVRSLQGLPLSLPGTTGAPRPMPGGLLHTPG